MTDIEALLRQNRLDEAKAALKAHLAVHPRDADAVRLLGRLTLHLGDAEEANRLFKRAAKLHTKDGGIWFECGVSHLALDEFKAAIAAFGKVLALDPGHTDARFNLGWAWRRLGHDGNAAAAFSAVTQADPGHAAAWFNLGNVLLDMGRAKDAEAALRQAIAPANADANADALNNLGLALKTQGRLAEAEEAFGKAIAAKPGFARPQANLAAILNATGREAQALTWWSRARDAAPDDMDTAIGQAQCLGLLEREDEAAALLSNALRRQPGHAGAWHALGVLDLGRNRHRTAIAHFQKALELDEEMALAWSNLGKARAESGLSEAATQAFRRALKLDPDNGAIHSNLIFHLMHQGGGAEVATAEARIFGQRAEKTPPLPALPRPDPGEAGRRLKIGYVSPDFRDHAVTFFFEPYLDLHQRSEFEVYCYCCHNRPDHVTARLKAKADHWRDISALPDDDAAALIRADGIDILIDLAGHTANNRLGVFARKPAPIQATWLGHPGTTGLTRIDYRLTDTDTHPAGAERYFSERLFRTYGAGICFRPPIDRPPVAAQPCLNSPRIRLASFNKLQKIGPDVLKVWARILDDLPQADLILVAPGASSPETAAAYRCRFAEAGIDPERLFLNSMMPLNPFLSLVTSVDLALDPWPYSGGTTSELTLMMGVPLIAMETQGVASSTAVLLRRFGLGELVARDQEEYVTITRGIAGAPRWLADFRRRIPGHVAWWRKGSELMTVRRQEGIYRFWWSAHVQGRPVDCNVNYCFWGGPLSPLPIEDAEPMGWPMPEEGVQEVSLVPYPLGSPPPPPPPEDD